MIGLDIILGDYRRAGELLRVWAVAWAVGCIGGCLGCFDIHGGGVLWDVKYDYDELLFFLS